MDTKKLRQKILDLAIRGKLVPQDPNDEPASVLLERIRAEKERLIKEGKIKTSKTSKTADTPHYENVPFEVPSSWVWTTLQNITTIIGDGLHGTPQYDSSGDYYFINGNNLLEHKIRIKEDTKRVSEKEYLKYQKPLNETSILVSINGTIGNIGTYNGEKVVLGKSACYFNISSLLHKVYFCYLLESDYFLKYALNSATGSTIKNVPLKAINEFFVPLPPLAEQERIVLEIKRLFTFIEQIEQGKINLQTVIKQAKSKILDLAIHGKLVLQDPNEEPASELLKRINPKAEITCDNGQYGKLPEKWVWTTVKDISKSILYGVSESAKSEGKYKLLRITDIQNNQVDWKTVPFTDFDDKKVSSYILHDGDIVFARTGATVGKSYLIKGLSQKAIYASYLIRVRTFDLILPEYVKLFFESGYYWEQIELSSVGIGQPNVNGTILGNLNIPLPPLAEQYRIVTKIEELFTSLDNIQKALEV